MMQTVSISDAVRCFLLNVPKGPNLVCPRETSLSSQQPSSTVLLKETLASHRGRVSLVSWQGIRLNGLASARALNGHRTWEIDRLFGPTSQKSWDQTCTEFLEKLVQEAGERFGERMILRLPSDSSTIRQARLAGFFPYSEEVLLVGQVSEADQNGSEPSPTIGRRLPQDDYGLFQLYCAGTPQQVRAGLGSTFDQWKDSQSPCRQGMREWVIRDKERITGWLGLVAADGWQEGQIMYHPGFPEVLPALLTKGLAIAGPHKWLIPDYQEMAQELLVRRGFGETARYLVLVKTVAAPIMAPGFAAVEA